MRTLNCWLKSGFAHFIPIVSLYQSEMTIILSPAILLLAKLIVMKLHFWKVRDGFVHDVMFMFSKISESLTRVQVNVSTKRTQHKPHRPPVIALNTLQIPAGRAWRLGSPLECTPCLAVGKPNQVNSMLSHPLPSHVKRQPDVSAWKLVSQMKAYLFVFLSPGKENLSGNASRSLVCRILRTPA